MQRRHRRLGLLGDVQEAEGAAAVGVGDKRVLSGIIYIKKNGLQWKDTPAVYGPPKTLYNRFVRWARMGVFARIFVELAQPGPDGDVIMIDSTHLKAHRTAASLSKGGPRPRAIGRTKGGLNSKLHMVCDGLGRPLTFFLSPGQMRRREGRTGPAGRRAARKDAP